MRILVVSQHYYPERFSVNDIAEGLFKLGHEVTVLTGRPNYGLHEIIPEYKHVKFEKINGINVHRVRVYPRKLSRISVIRNYLSFHRTAKRKVNKLGEFDLVLTISLSPVISIAPAIKYAKKHKVPCILYCQDLWPESTVVTGAVKKNSLLYKLLYKWSVSLYRECDRIIISSPSFKDYFENELHIKDKGFKTIYQPILNSNKNLEPVVYKNKHNIVYAGNIGKIQLTTQLVDAMRYVKSEDTKLYLMGMGSELNNIKHKIESEHITNVEYAGALPIEKAETYYKNADALIVSLKEGGTVGKTIPNKAIQYLKYGRPLLGVIKGDAKELLSKSNGTVFSDEDPKEIAKKIDELLAKSDKEKAQMGLNNKKFFEDNLSSEVLVKEFDQELKTSVKN